MDTDPRGGPAAIELSMDELREITGYAAACARRVLPLFERALPADPRPREAVEAAEAFAAGGRRTAALRRSAWAAYKAAQEAQAGQEAREGAPSAAEDAARAASHAAAAAFLHPRASAHQVKHVLGAAAHAARAEELAEEWAPADGSAPPAVSAVLVRLPPAPAGGGRVGEIVRDLDGSLRG